MKVTISTEAATIEVHGKAPMEEVQKLANVLREMYGWGAVSIQGTRPHVQMSGDTLENSFSPPYTYIT